MRSKVCTHCRKCKPLSDFHRNGNRPSGERAARGGDGRRKVCAACCAEIRKPGITEDRSYNEAMHSFGLKRCSACRSWEPFSCFSKNRAAKDRMCNQCKQCSKRTSAEHKARNPDYNKEWYARNRRQRSEYGKKWAASNRERVRQNWVIWYGANSEKVLGRIKGEIDSMSDGYIKYLLQAGSGMRFDDVPSALIDAKRFQLRITRLLKEKRS